MSPTSYQQIHFDICHTDSNILEKVFCEYFNEETTILIEKNRDDCLEYPDDSFELYKFDRIELYGIVPFPLWILKEKLISEYQRLELAITSEGKEYYDKAKRKFKKIHINHLPMPLFEGEPVRGESWDTWNIETYNYITPHIYNNYVEGFLKAYEEKSPDNESTLNDITLEKCIREIINTELNIPIPAKQELGIDDWNDYWIQVGRYFGGIWHKWELILKSPGNYSKKLPEFGIDVSHIIGKQKRIVHEDHSFKISSPSKTNKLTEVRNKLIENKFIPESVSPSDFKSIFSGDIVTNPITWLTNRTDLKYFINELLKLNSSDGDKLIKYSPQTQWKITVKCFIQANGLHWKYNEIRDCKPLESKGVKEKLDSAVKELI